MATTRVLIVGDDPLARNGLAMLLSWQPEIALVGQRAPSEAPDPAPGSANLLLWDLGPRGPVDLDTVGGIEAARVPVLAVLSDEEQAAGAVAAGARGLVFRGTDGPTLAAAARAVASGLVVIDAALRQTLLRPAPSGEILIEPLTARETEVLQLLAQGRSNKEIAQSLGISDHTAKFHVNAILGKLGARSRTEAIVQAARHGLVIL